MMLAALVVAAFVAGDAPLVPDDIKSDDDVVRALHEHYTKHEVDIPMRDGVKLHTDYWTPKDTGSSSGGRAWPFLMMRTPYSVSPYGVENFPDAKNHRAITRFAPSKELIRSGYIFVHQDVRGRMMSEGTFVEVRPMADPALKKKHDPRAIDESTDAWDTIDWLVKNVAHNNGKVGVWGISYPGFYAAQSAVDAHPALKAVAPMAPVTEWFIGDDFHHNGAFFLGDAFDFEANFGRAREKPTRMMKWDFEPENAPADLYDFFLQMGPLKNANAKFLEGKIAFWNEVMAHPNRDLYWQSRDPRPQYRDIKPGVLVVGGWFDAEDLWGALHTYASMESQSPNNDVHLVMGPWSHGGWHRTDGDQLGDISFGQKTSEHYQSEIETPFFESRLKGVKPSTTPEASVFVTGSDEWRSFAHWPPAESKPTALYLAPDFALSARAPTTAKASDSYVADPRKPVPYKEGAGPMDHDYMTADQRFAAHRPDVLAYETQPLASDVVIAGPVTASVWLESTGTDADVVVKLVDIWPEDAANPEPNPKKISLGGYEQLVRAEIMRARFRDSDEKPEALIANKPTLVKVALPDTAHTFRAGHRIAVQIQSSWFPLADSNPQTFVANINEANESDFKIATQTVHRSSTMPTSVTLPVLEGKLP